MAALTPPTVAPLPPPPLDPSPLVTASTAAAALPPPPPPGAAATSLGAKRAAQAGISIPASGSSTSSPPCPPYIIPLCIPPCISITSRIEGISPSPSDASRACCCLAAAAAAATAPPPRPAEVLRSENDCSRWAAGGPVPRARPDGSGGPAQSKRPDRRLMAASLACWATSCGGMESGSKKMFGNIIAN